MLEKTYRAVTLVELLVVMLIITLLATAAVPVLITRIEDARRATARQEVAEIAKAEQLVALAHNVYVPLQLLDDLPDDPDITQTGRDDIRNSSQGGTISLVLVTESADDQAGSQPTLTDADPIGGPILAGWRGPFLNPQRVWTGLNNQPNEQQFLTDTEARLDHPLDPYGQPYRFYSPAGIIGSSAENTNQASFNQNSFSNGVINTGVGGERFDRYAIVSFGPNGVPNDTGTGTIDDDIVYLFGFDPSESTFSPFF